MFKAPLVLAAIGPTVAAAIVIQVTEGRSQAGE
jgi:hypothetical protein